MESGAPKPGTGSAPRAPRSLSIDATLVGDGPILLCDWNGTLVDDADRAWRATCAVLRAQGLAAIDFEEFRARFKLPLPDFLSDLGVDGDVGNAVERWNDRLLLAAPPPPSPGVEDLLDRLEDRGVVVGVVSAAREDVVHSDIAALGLDARIQFVAAGVESKREVLAAIVASSARSVTYVGDTEHDMRAARRAGARAIGYAGGYRPAAALTAAGAASVVRTLSEVDRLLSDG